MQYNSLSFEKIKTYPAAIRHNLVRIDTLKTPGVDETPEWDGGEDFDTLVDRIVTARKNGRTATGQAERRRKRDDVCHRFQSLG